MKDEKVIVKIQKVLALAKNNTSEEEAQSAMLKAQALMAQHGVTEADLEIEGLAKDVVDIAITYPMKQHWWYKSLASVIAKNFRCHPYITHNGRLCLIGLKDDVEIAREVYFYAQTVITHHASEYTKKVKKELGYKPSNINATRNDYIMGFISGVSHKFNEQIKNNDWGLILVRDKAVDEVVKEKGLVKAQASRVSTSGDPNAWGDGFEKGKNFNHISGNIKA